MDKIILAISLIALGQSSLDIRFNNECIDKVNEILKTSLPCRSVAGQDIRYCSKINGEYILNLLSKEN